MQHSVDKLLLVMQHFVDKLLACGLLLHVHIQVDIRH